TSLSNGLPAPQKERSPFGGLSEIQQGLEGDNGGLGGTSTMKVPLPVIMELVFIWGHFFLNHLSVLETNGSWLNAEA
ncbi:hypothetical protein ACQP3C_29440, partial [Escherichia coli]